MLPPWRNRRRPAHTTIHESGDVKLTEYEIIKVEQWSGILEQECGCCSFFLDLLSWCIPAALGVQGGLCAVNQPHGLACGGSPCSVLHRSHVKTIGMQIKYLGGDFGPLGCGNQPSLVLWLIFVEWDIDLGSTFCKYLPGGRWEGLGTAAERKQPPFVFKVGEARSLGPGGGTLSFITANKTDDGLMNKQVVKVTLGTRQSW